MSDENITEERDRLVQQLADLGARFEKEQSARYGLLHENERLKKDPARLLEENLSLRDQLHEIELAKARLDGYQDRVREFDPVSDKTAYADETNPIMTRNRPDNDQYGDSPARLGTRSMAELAGFGGERRRAWYRRG